MLSGNPYISANSATRNALKAPNERQSRPVRGLKKLYANRMKTTELTMTSMTTMSAVHEHVHQRAQEKRQPDECTQDMGAVLGEQQHPGDNQKADQHQPCRRGEKAALIAMAGVIMHRYVFPIP